jgi:hypothetical protein
MPTTPDAAVLEPPPPAITRLATPPDTLATTVRALHLLAEQVVSPARERATGNEIALRWTPGGFGTPRFGRDEQVRVVGAELVVVSGGSERREPLDVDDIASRWLGDFYGLAYGALEALRADPRDGDAPTPVRLWPEHFDIAIEMGDEATGLRANYGASPGDDDHAEPYVYVGPWTARPEGALWNARSFPGAELTLSELLAADDHRAAVDAFFAARRTALAA